MPFEVYQNIYSAGQEGIILRPGKDAASFSFSAVPSDDTRYNLFVTGETALFYMWKDEPDYPSQYHLLTDALDTENLADYVRLGGTLILTHAHLTHTTNYQDITENRRAYKKQTLAFTSEAPVFTTDKVLGQEISVCGNLLKPDEVLAKTDNGRPLICRYRLGKGQVILFCADAYPAHPAIRPLYETLLANTMQTLTDKETVWGKTDGNTEFTLYRQPDGSNHIYFLAVDWYREPDTLRTGYLRIDTHEYPVTMPFGVMIKCVEKGGIAAWPDSENGEVLSVSNSEITVQGTGSVCFHLAADDKITKETVCFSDKNVKTVKLK